MAAWRRGETCLVQTTQRLLSPTSARRLRLNNDDHPDPKLLENSSGKYDLVWIRHVHHITRSESLKSLHLIQSTLARVFNQFATISAAPAEWLCPMTSV